MDPGTVHLGYGVLQDGARPDLKGAGVCHAPAGWPVARRLAHLQSGLRDVFERFHPHCVALETSFHGKNAQALLRLGEARGMVIGLAGSLGVAVHDYSPAMIKKAVTGRGNASKDQVAHMVRVLVAGLAPEIRSDATDALAAALCHCHRQRTLEQVQESLPRTPGRGVRRFP